MQSNLKLKEANKNVTYDPVLPKPEVIYTKTFHFMDESLLDKENRRKRKQQRREEREKKEAEEEPNEEDKKKES